MRIADPNPMSASTLLDAASTRRPAPTSAAQASRAGDAVALKISPAARQLAAASSVDPSKVAALRGSLAGGAYAVDPLRVARAMLSGA
jgi:flagellar biosynthesis anti-sigma factor FlgM